MTNYIFTSTPESSKLAERISDQLRTANSVITYQPNTVSFTNFPDSSLKIKLEGENFRGSHLFYLTHMTEGTEFSFDKNFSRLFFLMNALKQANVEKVTIINPYNPLSRQDRTPSRREPLGLNAMYLPLIRAYGGLLHSVVGVDVHNEQSTNIFDGIYTDLKASKNFIPYIKEQILSNEKLNSWILLSPDVGGVQRMDHYAKKLQIKSSFANKSRDPNSGQTSIRQLVGYEGQKKILSIDDVSDTCGTLIGLTEQISDFEQWHMFLTHLTAVNKEKLRALKDTGVTLHITDSCLTPRLEDIIRTNGINMISIAPNIAKAMIGIEQNKSLREVYLN